MSNLDAAILTEAERELLSDMSGCGCCSSRYLIEKVLPDTCPRDGDYVDHSYDDGCNQVTPVDEVAERLVRKHQAAALRAARDELRARMDGFSLGGRHTRAAWALLVLAYLADQIEHGTDANPEARPMSAQNPASLPSSIDARPEPSPSATAPEIGPQAANLGDGAIGRLSEAGRAALWLQVRQALVVAWRDDYSVKTVTDGVTDFIEQQLAAIVREHTERALAEVEQRIKDRLGVTSRALPIVRAARQEQDRG